MSPLITAITLCSLWKKWCTAHHPCTTGKFYTHFTFKRKQRLIPIKLPIILKNQAAHATTNKLHTPQSTNHKLSTHIKSTARVSTGYSVIKLFNLYYCVTQCIGLHSSIEEFVESVARQWMKLQFLLMTVQVLHNRACWWKSRKNPKFNPWSFGF